MNILKISNSALARHVSLDPSYISRLRNGHRQPSYEADYLEDMVKYFINSVLQRSIAWSSRQWKKFNEEDGTAQCWYF